MQIIRQFFTWFAKQNLPQKVIIGLAGLYVLSALWFSFPITSLNPPAPTLIDVSSIQTTAFETVMAGSNQTPTIAPPTNTTEPTYTPSPIPSATNTPDPYIYLFEVTSLVFLDHDANRGNGAGLKVYMGEQKVYIFEIIGGGDCPSMPSGQGYLVRYPDTGNEEWKDRLSMEESELFVADDTFSLYTRDWKIYYNCP